MTAVADLEAPPRDVVTPRRRRVAAPAPARLGSPAPWGRADLTGPGVLGAVGAVVVAVAWNGASREEVFREQIGWIVLAAAGFGVFALGGAWWILVGFRRTRQCRAQLRIDFANAFAEPLPGVDARPPDDVGGLVTGPGMRWAHRPDCLLVRDKAVRPLGPDEGDVLAPCAMCH
ncbi:hypothetical protein GCM10009547_34290 [Sporichthya brevicatena]|uniref:Uncharacterized protein n=1 Tax=Sporichthya brevicatena TaxID=171442 RepID=A0ABN1H374_9ACTN